VAAGMILISQYFSISHFGVIQQDDIPAQRFPPWSKRCLQGTLFAIQDD
jgi:hypothetical protein